MGAVEAGTLDGASADRYIRDIDTKINPAIGQMVNDVTTTTLCKFYVDTFKGGRDPAGMGRPRSKDTKVYELIAALRATDPPTPHKAIASRRSSSVARQASPKTPWRASAPVNGRCRPSKQQGQQIARPGTRRQHRREDPRGHRPAWRWGMHRDRGFIDKCNRDAHRRRPAQG